jgi:incFII family plasmid replication initiator RepA
LGGFYYYDACHHKTSKLMVRVRHFNKHRARAINALVHAMVYHLNIISGTIPVSFTTLAHEAGLSTCSKAGNTSITRATRAAQELAAYGLITYKLLWDKVTRHYFPRTSRLPTASLTWSGVLPRPGIKPVTSNWPG